MPAARPAPVGAVFNRLTVLEKVRKIGAKNPTWFWRCICLCGKEVLVQPSTARNGAAKSCGCLRNEQNAVANLKHGCNRDSGRDPTYTSWAKIVQRCTNSNNDNYHRYGGRGITVCDSWRNSFENFLADMGSRPVGTSIERVDNNKGYSKSNCKWATRKEQTRNRTNSVKLGGVLVQDLAAKHSLDVNALTREVRRGTPLREAVALCAARKRGPYSGKKTYAKRHGASLV